MTVKIAQDVLRHDPTVGAILRDFKGTAQLIQRRHEELVDAAADQPVGQPGSCRDRRAP